MTQHHVGRLASNARQHGQQRHVGRHFAAMLRDERLGHADQGLRFLAEEAGGFDLLLERWRTSFRQGGRIQVALEQGGCDEVDPRIGRLRRQDGGDQQLERRPVVQLSVGVRVLFPITSL